MPINKMWLVLFVIIFVLIYIFWPRNEPELVVEDTIPMANTEIATPSEEHDMATIVVDLKGAVRTPGVYEMNNGQRVIDVIEKAGGMTEQADETSVNLAMLLMDEMVIHVLNKNSDTHNTTVHESNSNKIRINTADVNELTNIAGIGEQKAKAIIQYREEHGFFKTEEDLLNISGIGEKTLERIREFIIVP